MKFSDISSYVTAQLEDLGYDPTALDGSFPIVDPGPPVVPELLKRSTGRIIFLGMGGGPGLTTEALYDRLFIQARVVGQQEDYDDAETLATQLDTMLLKLGSNSTVGTARVLYVTRAGGAPQLLMKDAADRYHFQCTYITEAQTALGQEGS